MSNSIQFWLSFNNGAERIRLPVNPPVISVNSPFGFEDIEVSQLGEITIIKERGLKEISFSTFLPKFYNASYCEYTDIPEPTEIIRTIERWRDSRKPIRLVITGTDVNMACTIRDLGYEQERAGSPGDIYFDMTLKEYRFVVLRTAIVNERGEVLSDAQLNDKKYFESRLAYARQTNNSGLESWCIEKLKELGFTVKRQITIPTPATTQRPSDKVQSKTYTVKSGDSLWSVAKKTLGDGSKWTKIKEANNLKSNTIYSGQVLVIPNA